MKQMDQLLLTRPSSTSLARILLQQLPLSASVRVHHLL
jgi:hypothetical protein